MVTFAVFLMFWVINWIASFTGPTTQAVLNYLSITEHLNDFTRGVIDTKHSSITCVSLRSACS